MPRTRRFALPKPNFFYLFFNYFLETGKFALKFQIYAYNYIFYEGITNCINYNIDNFLLIYYSASILLTLIQGKNQQIGEQLW